MAGEWLKLSTALAGQKLGIKEVDEGIWVVSLMQYDLGYFDLEQKTLQPLDNPFGTRLSPMSSVRSVTDVSGLDNAASGGAGARQYNEFADLLAIFVAELPIKSVMPVWQL